MAICPNCGKKINKNTGNKRKVRGIMMHKECPEARIERLAKAKEGKNEKAKQ